MYIIYKKETYVGGNYSIQNLKYVETYDEAKDYCENINNLLELSGNYREKYDYKEAEPLKIESDHHAYYILEIQYEVNHNEKSIIYDKVNLLYDDDELDENVENDLKSSNYSFTVDSWEDDDRYTCYRCRCYIKITNFFETKNKNRRYVLIDNIHGKVNSVLRGYHTGYRVNGYSKDYITLIYNI